MSFFETKAYHKFQIEFSKLKERNKETLSCYSLVNNLFKWPKFSKSDFSFVNKKDFMQQTGLVPIWIDTENEDIYCYLPQEDKIGVYSGHTIVHLFKNLDDILIHLKEITTHEK